MESVQSTFKPAITFLNLTGDITISWDAANEKAILAMVEQKMKEDFSFFILRPRFFGLLGKKKVRAGSVADVADAGLAVMEDRDFDRMMSKLHDPAVESLLADGEAALTDLRSESSLDTVCRAKSAAEVVANQSIAVRRVVGG